MVLISPHARRFSLFSLRRPLGECSRAAHAHWAPLPAASNGKTVARAVSGREERRTRWGNTPPEKRRLRLYMLKTYFHGKANTNLPLCLRALRAVDRWPTPPPPFLPFSPLCLPRALCSPLKWRNYERRCSAQRSLSPLVRDQWRGKRRRFIRRHLISALCVCAAGRCSSAADLLFRPQRGDFGGRSAEVLMAHRRCKERKSTGHM